MDIQALIGDDEFVKRIARAAGLQLWASDTSGFESPQAADAAAEAETINWFRAELLEAFKGYKAKRDTPHI